MALRTVLCFGDSNTHGSCAMRTNEDRRRFPRELRWPNRMAAVLGAGWEVIAEGHPGRTSVFDDPIEGPHKNGQAALPALLETHRPIDLVIVLVGTNDLKARFNQSAQDIALGAERVVGTILSSDSGPDRTAPRVLLAAPANVRETGALAQMFAGAEAKSAQVPGHLAAVAQRRGLSFIDVNTVAQVDPVDGVHLTAQAHAEIGAAMAKAVLDVFKE